MAITIEDIRGGSWRDSVERFVNANADWLSEGHLPQLKALYEVASILDRTSRPNAALVSQFTLTQRTLAAKAPAAKAPAGDGSGPIPGDRPFDFDGLLDQ
jgi:hypothetical protein